MDITEYYDPLDQQTLVDPYPIYARLRETSPVFWHDGMRSWVLTRYEDCREVLRDYSGFARDRRRVGEQVPEFRQSLQSLDPPEHKPLRSLLANALRTQQPVVIAQQARDMVGALLTKFADADSFDWMRDVAAPVSLSITAELLGVAKPDGDLYAEISDGIAQRMDAGAAPERAAVGDRARHRLNQLVENWMGVDERPGLLADVRRDADRARLPAHYLRNTTGMMFNASYGTIYATAGNVALTLLRNPWVIEELRRDERLLDTAVDELIRFDGPAQGTSRVATRQLTIGGVEVGRGEIVLTLLAAANRDPDQFRHPERLVLDREPNPHLAFGWGPHACLGMIFGKAVISELARGLLQAPRPLRLAGPVTRRPTATVRTIGHFPVTFREEFAACEP